jgi:hypothetical protein
MLSAIMASIVVIKKNLKSRWCSAAKATFLAGVGECCGAALEEAVDKANDSLRKSCK